jgi:hypothetical protein
MGGAPSEAIDVKPEPVVYTTAEVQSLLRIGRATAQRIAREIGIRVSPRRIVVPRVRLEAWLEGRTGNE